MRSAQPLARIIAATGQRSSTSRPSSRTSSLRKLAPATGVTRAISFTKPLRMMRDKTLKRELHKVITLPNVADALPLTMCLMKLIKRELHKVTGASEEHDYALNTSLCS